MFISSKTLVSFLLVAAASTDAKVGQSRQLSFERFHTFTPMTKVTDHAAIDLDQEEIAGHLSGETPQYGKVKLVYENGGHSKSVATLTVPAGLEVAYEKGTEISGTSVDGETITGSVYKAAEQGALSIQVQYTTTGVQATYVGCQVGGSDDPVTGGCFADSGTLDFAGATIAYDGVTNGNKRTIQGFSTNEDKFKVDGVGEFYPDFNMFQEYYGTTQYADEWVSAAISGTATDFTLGNARFNLAEDDSRLQAIKKGTAYISVFMYVIRELEDALDDCKKGCDRDECNDDAVHALDEAVAFYTGSLHITSGDGKGQLLWDLANKRCSNFNTCDGGKTADVNNKIFSQFIRMQDNLNKKDCDAATANKVAIANHMYIPMIQGTLRYAYFSGKQDDQSEKSEAEGATFAAAVLPKLHNCNAADALTVYENMKIAEPTPTDFVAVKQAFERNYACMDVTCADVGGLGDGADYFEAAAPCSGSMMVNVGLAFGAAAAAVVALL